MCAADIGILQNDVGLSAGLHECPSSFFVRKDSEREVSPVWFKLQMQITRRFTADIVNGNFDAISSPHKYANQVKGDDCDGD